MQYDVVQGASHGEAADSSEGDLVAPLQREHGARVGGSCDFQSEAFDDLSRHRNLLGARGGELALAGPKTVFQSNPDIASKGHRLRRDAQLTRSGAEYGPAIVRAEQPVGRSFHMLDILGVSSDSTENPEHALDEIGRLNETPADKMRQVIEMSDVVTLELEARAVPVAGLENILDILEGVAEDQVFGGFEVRLFPIELERFVSPNQRVEPEVDRSHVERRELRSKSRGRLRAFLNLHVRTTPRRDVDHRVGALFHRQETGESFRRLVRLTGLRVAGMQVENRGPRFRRPDRRSRNLVGGDR